MSDTRTVSGKSARGAAKLFNYGNIVAVLLPFPLIIFWFGASMFVYAMNRHHPNPRVGHYTQQAAYRFYAILGFLIVAGTFFPPELKYFLIYWAITAAILIPWSVRDILRINREEWSDVDIPTEQSHA
ncbi:MAG: hypothetical protein PHQ14_03310 [Chromatiales bacterium]|jgi:uncharacterized membrane protein|nr:hypothetical protein [Chromatiales bacterium]MDX9767522.1 hypothetical protein [Ectothiorhodospiraceae bacterium]